MREFKQTSIQIKDSPLLRGELYWCRPSGRKLCVGHAGEFANLDLIEKLSSTNDQFIQEVLIDEERVSKIIDHFSNLKEARLEDVKMRYRNLILVDFYRVLKGEQKSSTLDFLFICYEVFNDLEIDDKNIEEEFIKTNALTLKKAQVAASVVIYMALVSGYSDYYFLKEIYNTIVLTYYSYVSRHEHIIEEYSNANKEIVNQVYLKELSSRFFKLNYNLSDDISSIWTQVHHKVFSLELEFNESDLENIFKSILQTVKEYRYIDEIMTQESSR